MSPFTGNQRLQAAGFFSTCRLEQFSKDKNCDWVATPPSGWSVCVCVCVCESFCVCAKLLLHVTQRCGGGAPVAVRRMYKTYYQGPKALAFYLIIFWKQGHQEVWRVWGKICKHKIILILIFPSPKKVALPPKHGQHIYIHIYYIILYIYIYVYKKVFMYLYISFIYIYTYIYI